MLVLPKRYEDFDQVQIQVEIQLFEAFIVFGVFGMMMAWGQ